MLAVDLLLAPAQLAQQPPHHRLLRAELVGELLNVSIYVYIYIYIYTYVYIYIYIYIAP